MKVVLRILIVFMILILIAYCSEQSNKENSVLEAPTKPGQAFPNMSTPIIENKSSIPRPDTGISVFIGKPATHIIRDYGEPDRIDPSEYGFEWWIYSKSYKTYMMVGVKNGVITQVFVGGNELSVSPYKIGQSIDDIYRTSIIESEITVQIGSNIYMFTLNEADMNNRLLIKFDEIFAQLYIDEKEESLVAVRFINPESLVLQKPYDMTYSGDLMAPNVPSSNLQLAIDLANERQLLDITNLYRFNNSLQQLHYEPLVNIATRMHSEDMAKENFFSHESPEYGSLEERLEVARIGYDSVGENIATNYIDGVEAVHGWLNSDDHRDLLLNEDFTHLGSGVFGKYYTQIFITREKLENKTEN